MAEKTNPIIDKLFSVGAHFGYTPRRRHPTSVPFLFGAKGGVELFDLEKTAAQLEAAAEFIKKMAEERKVVLFVGGKAEAQNEVRRAARMLNQPYVASRWIGGTLTNWGEIKKRLSLLATRTDERAGGELTKYTKRERLLIDREIADLEAMFGGIKSMEKLPDALVVIDPRAESGAVEEANQLKIPVVALMNSDCNARVVQYPIPANDASQATISYVLQVLADAYAKNLGDLRAEAPAGVN